MPDEHSRGWSLQCRLEIAKTLFAVRVHPLIALNAGAKPLRAVRPKRLTLLPALSDFP